MMKGMIQSNSHKETELAYIAYMEFVKKNGHNFKVKKPQSKISHKTRATRTGTQTEAHRTLYQQFGKIWARTYESEK